MTLQEFFRFQGFDDADVKDLPKKAGISDRAMAHMLGNGLSLNVAERVIGAGLWAAGLVAKKPNDRWAPSSARASKATARSPDTAI